MDNRILKIDEVKNKVGLSRSSIYLLIQRKQFPSQIKLTERSSGWLEFEINQWIEDRITASRQDQSEVQR